MMTMPRETLPFRPRGGLCRVCGVDAGAPHATACPVVVLDGHMRELTAHMGIFISQVSETLEAMSAILADRRRE
jgi:hypothetical protein